MADQDSAVTGLNQAIQFSLDVQEIMQQNGACMKNLNTIGWVIRDILPKYPGCIVTDVITFSDGSIATLIADGSLNLKSPPIKSD